jgi:hypothetical protein
MVDASSERFRPLSAEEWARVSSQEPVTSESVDRLNKTLQPDPGFALRLVTSLLVDPSNWNHLFSLDDAQSSKIPDVSERSRSVGSDVLLDTLAAVGDRLGEVTLQVNGLHDGEPTQESEDANPWWAPDTFTLTMSGTTTTAGGGSTSETVSGALGWHFP